MSRAKSILSGALWTAVTAALLWAGNRAGHSIAQAGWLSHPPAPRSIPGGRDAAALPPRQRPQSPHNTESVGATLERLAALGRTSVDLRFDWEAQREMERLLAGRSATELEQIFAGLDAADIPARWLLTRVGALWAEKDPDAAMQAALGKSGLRTDYWAAVVFNTWSADHPLEALAWLDRTTVLDTKLQERFRGEVVSGLIERDFALAGAEYLKLKGKTAAEVMESWGGWYADRPEMREQLLALVKTTGRPEDFTSLNRGLVEHWPQEDVLGTITYLRGLKSYLESGAVPTEGAVKTDASAVAAAIGREYTAPAIEWWMERHASESAAPYALQQAVQTWTRKSPDDAFTWLSQQPASPQRDALGTTISTSLAKSGKYDQATQSVEAISDATARQQAAEVVSYFWTMTDPNAATAWRKKLKTSSAK